MAEDLAYLRTLTLLYVEDVAVVREHTRKILEPLVGNLVVAEGGAEGLAAFTSHHPQIIVTDIVMPCGDGLGMAGDIRVQDPRVPIIVTTAYDNTDYLVHSIDLKVEKYVFKPVDPVAMKLALLACAHRLRAREQLVFNRQLEAAQLRIQHQVAMGNLALGMGHDFNNLLQGVLGAISVAMLSTPVNHPLHGVLELAERSASQARELGHRLLTLAKGCGPLNQAGPLGPLLRAQAEAVLRGAAITCQFDLPEDAPVVRYDEQDLATLLGILLTNALEAMPAGGTLTLVAQPCTLTEKDGLDLPCGPYLRHTFRDSGSGIAAEVLPRVFDPYFTTKSIKNQKGIGLSLAIAQAIAWGHGGALLAEPGPGPGATFHLLLPAS